MGGGLKQPISSTMWFLGGGGLKTLAMKTMWFLELGLVGGGEREED